MNTYNYLNGLFCSDTAFAQENYPGGKDKALFSITMIPILFK